MYVQTALLSSFPESETESVDIVICTGLSSRGSQGSQAIGWLTDIAIELGISGRLVFLIVSNVLLLIISTRMIMSIGTIVWKNRQRDSQATISFLTAICADMSERIPAARTCRSKNASKNTVERANIAPDSTMIAMSEM